LFKIDLYLLTSDKYIVMSGKFYKAFSHDVTAAKLVSLDSEKAAMLVYQTNRPLLSCPLPLRQNKSLCETIVMKMRFISKLFSCKSNSFSQEKFCTRSCTETEAKFNSEMAYSVGAKLTSYVNTSCCSNKFARVLVT